MAKVPIEGLLDAKSPWSSKRWIAIRSSQTLGVISFLLTLAVLYQAVKAEKIDPQLSFLCNGVYYALALLAGAAVWKKDAVPSIDGPAGTTTETTTKTLEVSRDVAEK